MIIPSAVAGLEEGFNDFQRLDDLFPASVRTVALFQRSAASWSASLQEDRMAAKPISRIASAPIIGGERVHAKGILSVHVTLPRSII